MCWVVSVATLPARGERSIYTLLYIKSNYTLLEYNGEWEVGIVRNEKTMKIIGKSLKQQPLLPMDPVWGPPRKYVSIPNSGFASVPTPTFVSIPAQSTQQKNTALIALTACLSLTMISAGIFGPVVAKHLTLLGSGLTARSIITLAPSAAHLLFASFAGNAADRYGRRPLILFSFLGAAVVNVAFLFAHTVAIYIGIRFLQGAVSVGVLPAAMGILGDTVSEQERTRWIGIMMAGFATGFLIGPTLGGWLFDHWGFIAAYGFSALFNLGALLLGLKVIPETGKAPKQDKHFAFHDISIRDVYKNIPLAFKSPQSRLLMTLLSLDFIMMFVMAFIEPQLMVYAYKVLLLKPTQYGLMMSAFGLSTLVGQLTIGRISLHVNKKLSVTLGFLLKSCFSFSLLLFRNSEILFLGALFAGFGRALIGPTLGAFYLNITRKQRHSSIIGMKESIAALGGIAGPLLAACSGPLLQSRGTFLVSGVVAIGGALLAFILL